MTTLGSLRYSQSSQNIDEIEDLARYAVDEHNRKQNVHLEFKRVVNAHEYIVAIRRHTLTIEAIDAGEVKTYEAKVWVKPWMNFKQLKDFKLVSHAPSFTSADHGVKKDGHKLGWQSVPIHDRQVQDAASHAIKTIQQRSNSQPYELHEVVDAKAEVKDDSAKFNMLLKVKRGDKEEKFKVEVHKNNKGSFHLNQIEPHHS
ncbi:cysteine proteinase inhibitor 6-like [Gastrolobium bilobum]|uniref:cysteine proteinase inhibitor 6-like n=1 Tax=Gastrolobium bilobum TaxID=150636 RepID=UPI002AB266F4|nr:cysteine proteinase inhibitor 6-like [Gastrolobium bilobum]